MNELEELPTAVTVRNVLALITAHVEKDEHTFKERAKDIAEELTMNGKDELAHYIYAQLGLVRTFEEQTHE